MRVGSSRIRILGAGCMACALLLSSACTGPSESTNPDIGSPAPAPKHVDAPVPTATPEQKQRALQRMQACRVRLEAAMKNQIVSNASVDNGRPILWVGAAWTTTAPAMQEKMVLDTACFFISGDDTRTIKFSVYDTATDQELAVWNHTYLVRP